MIAKVYRYSGSDGARVLTETTSEEEVGGSIVVWHGGVLKQINIPVGYINNFKLIDKKTLPAQVKYNGNVVSSSTITVKVYVLKLSAEDPVKPQKDTSNNGSPQAQGTKKPTPDPLSTITTIEDQAILLLNLKKIIEEANKKVNLKIKHKNFIRINTNTLDGTRHFVNRLFNPKKVNRFLSASPAFISSLIPKVKIYKVISIKDTTSFTTKLEDYYKLNPSKQRNSYSFLVPFESSLDSTNISEEDFFKEYGKSYGAGIDSITIMDASSIENPTRITTDLKLKFSNFDMLFKTYELTSEEDDQVKAKFSFKDLFSRDAAKTDSRSGTTNDPVDDDSFRIKLVIGWSYNKKLLKRINYGSTELTKEDIQDIETALENSSYTYYLGHKSFNLAIEDTGVIKADISYLSSLEAIFSSRKANVIYTTGKDGRATDFSSLVQSLNEFLKLKEQFENASSVSDIDKSSKAKKSALDSFTKKVKDDIAKIDKKVKDDYYHLHRQFMTNLFKNSRIFSIKIPREEIQKLRDLMYLSKKKSQTNPNSIPSMNVSNLTIENFCRTLSDKNIETILKETDSPTQLDIESEKERDKDKQIVNFIFLGDILEYVFGSLNRDSIEFRQCIPIVGNFCFGLPSVYEIKKDPDTQEEYLETKITDKDIGIYNLCDLPISLERFKRFLYEEFINKQAQVMKLDDFLKQLFNNVVFNALEGAVFGESIRNIFGNLIIGQSNLRTISSQNQELEFFTRQKYEDILDRKVQLDPINMDSMDFKKNYIPVATQENYVTSHLFNYYYIFSKVYDVLKGQVINFENRDSEGIVNVQIGADKGFVKKVNFNKNNKIDMSVAMFAERRSGAVANPFYLQGIMNVDIDMVGNTFFKNGSMFYLDPSFMLKYPGVPSLEAVQFGLGGYYYVTKVVHEISSGKFSTKVNGQYSHGLAPKAKVVEHISTPNSRSLVDAYAKLQELESQLPK